MTIDVELEGKANSIFSLCIGLIVQRLASIP
jgi:hypothetical protein